MARPLSTTTPKPKTASTSAKTPAPKKPAAPAKAVNEETTTLVSAIAEGQAAPSFKLRADDGSEISLADLRGKKVVLYFYPKDNTPGCTRESCDFEASQSALRKKGAVILGVSRDSSATHVGFKKKQGLTFPLLTDADTSVHRAYGAWGTKTMYGRTMEGALRTTVIIDEKGKIQKIFPRVKVEGHAAAVLAAL